jgi:hypothetical protein
MGLSEWAFPAATAVAFVASITFLTRETLRSGAASPPGEEARFRAFRAARIGSYAALTALQAGLIVARQAEHWPQVSAVDADGALVWLLYAATLVRARAHARAPSPPFGLRLRRRLAARAAAAGCAAVPLPRFASGRRCGGRGWRRARRHASPLPCPASPPPPDPRPLPVAFQTVLVLRWHAQLRLRLSTVLLLTMLQVGGGGGGGRA